MKKLCLLVVMILGVLLPAFELSGTTLDSLLRTLKCKIYRIGVDRACEKRDKTNDVNVQVLPIRWGLLHWVAYAEANNLVAKRYTLEHLKYLIEGGVDINLQDRFGQTPSHIIAPSCDEMLLFKWMRAGADMQNIQDRWGRTVTGVVKQKCSPATTRRFKEFVQHHSDNN